MQNPSISLTSESNSCSSNFSEPSLKHIQQATAEVLIRYLDHYDPFDQEYLHGSVSGLLDVLEKIGSPLLKDARGVTHTLQSVRTRVDSFLEKLYKAPVANPDNLAAYLNVLKRAGIEPSSLNLHRYNWDLWELRALVVGVSRDLAQMGRGALRRQYFCDNPLQEMDPEVLLFLAISKPEQAEALLMRFLVHCSIDDFGFIDLPNVRPKTYN